MKICCSGVIAGTSSVATSTISTISTISIIKHVSIMTVIAVAGGAGGVGKTIVEKLLDSKFGVVVLSRSVC